MWGKMQSLDVTAKDIHDDEVWPRRVDVPGKVVRAACGQAHSCFMTGTYSRRGITSRAHT